MDRIEAALAEVEARRRSRTGALLTAVATFAGAAIAAGVFLSRPPARTPPAPTSSPEASVPIVLPVEPPAVQSDPAIGHSLPVARFGEEEPQPPARSLSQVEARPAVKSGSRPGLIGVVPPIRPLSPPTPKAAPAPKPALQNALSDSSRSGGFVAGASMGAAAPDAAGGRSEDAAVQAARDPAGYDRREREAAVRAMKALLEKNGAMQAIQMDKQEIYAAQEAVEAVLEQNHSNFKDDGSAKSKPPHKKLPDAVQPGKVVLPENLPKELEKLRDRFGKGR